MLPDCSSKLSVIEHRYLISAHFLKVSTKRVHNVRVEVKIYVGQNRDYSRMSTSDSLERLLPGGGGGRSGYKALVEGSVQSSAYFITGFLLVMRADVTTEEGMQCFSRCERCKDWGHEISSWKYRTIKEPVPPDSLEPRAPHSHLSPSGMLKVISLAALRVKSPQRQLQQTFLAECQFCS